MIRVHLIQAFEAEPEAPVFEFPFDLELENPWTGKKILDYHHVFKLDMSDYEPVIRIFRIFEIIFFIIGLLMITRQQIKRDTKRKNLFQISCIILRINIIRSIFIWFRCHFRIRVRIRVRVGVRVRIGIRIWVRVRIWVWIRIWIRIRLLLQLLNQFLNITGCYFRRIIWIDFRI